MRVYKGADKEGGCFLPLIFAGYLRKCSRVTPRMRRVSRNYADDGVDESVDEFTSGTLSLGLNDLASTVAAELLGARVDTNGVLVNSTNDIAPYVAVGFRARKANGKYRYFWLYRVKFGVPATNLATKGESITFQTPTIEGTVMRRNKPDTQDKHPWKTEVTDGDTGVTAATISGWFSAVYEPTF